jgi:hypothetical protein
MKTSPNKIIFKDDGSLDYRIGGRWFYNRRQIPREDILSFPDPMGQKVWQTGYFLGRELVADLKDVGEMVWPYSS